MNTQSPGEHLSININRATEQAKKDGATSMIKLSGAVVPESVNLAALTADQEMMLSDIARAVAIVGSEDDFASGSEGTIEVTGELATLILQNCGWVESFYKHHIGKPVRVQRCGGLEIWCNGIYKSGSGCRRIIHSAARAFYETLPQKPQS